MLVLSQDRVIFKAGMKLAETSSTAMPHIQNVKVNTNLQSPRCVSVLSVYRTAEKL